MDIDLITAHDVDTELEARIFDSEDSPADQKALDQLLSHTQDADLLRPPVVLPDFHHKSTMEMPSSIAVATRGTIRPTLTSASLNCGMALMSLDIERPGPEAVTDFFTAVRDRFPYPAKHRRDLSADEVLRCAAEGAHFAIDRFDARPDELERIELGGRLDLDAYGGADRVRRELPLSVVQLSRMRFGTVGPSNHFVELQQVEEIFDAQAAAILGVHQGQVTMQYHCGGGVLAGEIGALFGRRKRMTKPLRLQMAVAKPLYHLASARSLDELRLRMRLYFADDCPPVPLDSAEGERLMLANSMALNYGFAYRFATYSGLRKIAREVLGAEGGTLVVDSPHNSIYEEQIGGERAIIHRHNAARGYPSALMPEGTAFGRVGQALLLPGTNRTSSYLCVTGENAERSLYSACHGAGSVIKDFATRGLSQTDPQKRQTMRFGYSDAAAEVRTHLDDRGVNEALGILVDNGLARPVARMRPFGVLN
jgi:tRNA-splicing ligase RtcB (3'-phosphate/5'-hydroxy nucleic acid ligase)